MRRLVGALSRDSFSYPRPTLRFLLQKFNTRSCAMTERDGAANSDTYVLATGAGDPAERLRLVNEVYGASTRAVANLFI